jgi:hypothetical protein
MAVSSRLEMPIGITRIDEDFKGGEPAGLRFERPLNFVLAISARVP